MPDLRLVPFTVTRFVNPLQKNPLWNSTLRPISLEVTKFVGGIAKTTLSGTIKDKNGVGVRRAFAIFTRGQLITPIARSESASDGTFSVEVDGNDNDTFTVIALGDNTNDEDCPIASRIKGQAV